MRDMPYLLQKLHIEEDPVAEAQYLWWEQCLKFGEDPLEGDIVSRQGAGKHLQDIQHNS
jgi:hypothetical protein